MSNNIQFDSDQYQGKSAQVGASELGMAGWLIRKGWAKNNTVAQIELLGVVIINIVICFLILKLF